MACFCSSWPLWMLSSLEETVWLTHGFLFHLILLQKRHNSGNVLSFCIIYEFHCLQPFFSLKLQIKKIITEAFTDGGQVVSVLSYFANRVPTQIQFAQLGPATQHVLQLLHTHKSRENPTEEMFCYFLGEGGFTR